MRHGSSQALSIFTPACIANGAHGPTISIEIGPVQDHSYSWTAACASGLFVVIELDKSQLSTKKGTTPPVAAGH